jgi:hypothetical protein
MEHQHASNCASRKTDPYEKPYPCDCDPIRALIEHIDKAGFIYSYEPIFERAKAAIAGGSTLPFRFMADPSVPEGTVEFRARDGRLLGKIVGLSERTGAES